ncbi:MAG: ornithine carbamoyltransferase [Candidatus Aenigmarchaeota archaeon]|nr:ornithine carbamoyltransferase [Candidatus Aenigmarchaeota archaeon]
MNLLSINDIEAHQFKEILELAHHIKVYPEYCTNVLKGKMLVLYFEKPSTRTRLSFEAAMKQLGGHALFFDIPNSHLGKGKEDLRDTAQVIAQYADIIAARVYKNETLEKIASYVEIPVINALSDKEHPCQALADVLTILEHKGKTAKVAYVGDGNNVCNSLALACAKLGISITVSCPPGYEPAATVSVVRDPAEAVQDADVVYTDVWVSMGNEHEAKQREKDFMPYQVDAALMERAKPGAIFMHCLPAVKGSEVSADVIEGPQSVVLQQAANRLHVQKALLLLLNETAGKRESACAPAQFVSTGESYDW